MSDELWLFKSYSEESDVEAVTSVIERGTWWAGGPEVTEFEERIADTADRSHGVSFNSGTTALYAALLACDVASGEVVVPSFTYPATANAVVAAGATPVFADIERKSLGLDPDSVRSVITNQTEAIVPIHFAGAVCSGIEELVEIADEHDLALIEDAAHSLAATRHGKPVGSFGDAAMFSFAFNKLLATGEGGMLVTDSEEIQQFVTTFRSQGKDEEGAFTSYGLNFNMSSLTAALGVSQHKKLEFLVSRRRELASYLNAQLEEIDGVRVPTSLDGQERVYQTYNIRFEDPEIQPQLQTYLDEQGIPSRVTYPPTHLRPYYREQYGWSEGDLPVTEKISTRILTLPFHPDLQREDLEYVTDHIHSFFA